MNNLTLFYQVLIIFLLMLIGVYAKKMNLIDNKLNKGLSGILMNITFPLNIIVAFNFTFSKDVILGMLTVIIFGMLIFPISYYLCKLLYLKFPSKEKNIMIFASVFSNSAFMAFPLLESIYGKTGVLYGSMFVIPFNLFLWTLGVHLYSDNNKAMSFKTIINPGAIGVLIGIFLFVLSIKLPYPIQRTFELVGGMTTPIAMIITGVALAELNIKEVFSSKSIYFVSIIRLALVPIITAIILKLCGITGVVYGVCLLVAAMPAASMTTVFAEKYDSDSSFASKNVFITTVLSLFTIPIIAILFIN